MFAPLRSPGRGGWEDCFDPSIAHRTEMPLTCGLSARKSGGVMVVRAADVALALADRAEDVTDATDGGVDDEG